MNILAAMIRDKIIGNHFFSFSPLNRTAEVKISYSDG